MHTIRPTVLVFAALAALATLAGAQKVAVRMASAPVTTRGNVLLIVTDDVGIDQIASYGVGSDLPNMPNVDALAQSGVRFETVWSNPVCSATRAAILTGRYGFRTGIGHTVELGPGPLPLGEVTIPEMLDRGTRSRYEHGAFGKWHLGASTVGGPLNPNLAGFDAFHGTLTNPPSYYAYEKVDDGIATISIGPYVTSVTVDDAALWIKQRSRPWFAYVAFNAGHQPWEAPPANLHSVDLSSAPPPLVDPRPYYRAILEAMDTEIGRLLALIGPEELAETTVIFVGDNGTPSATTVAPFDPLKAKATLYEGGIRVPLIVAGPAVQAPGSVSQAFVSTTDLFATVAELTGANLTAALPRKQTLDSISIVRYLRNPSAPSLRTHLYAEIFKPNQKQGPYTLEGRAMRDTRWKLIRSSLVTDPLYGPGFFDLLNDPTESQNLFDLPALTPEQTQALQDLDGRIDALLAS